MVRSAVVLQIVSRLPLVDLGPDSSSRASISEPTTRTTESESNALRETSGCTAHVDANGAHYSDGVGESGVTLNNSKTWRVGQMVTQLATCVRV